MNKISIPKLIRYAIGAMIFSLLFSQVAGWAIEEKPFLERLWIGVKGTGSGGLIGAGIGIAAGLLTLGSGGIGVAAAGAGYKLLGWATFGLIGFSAGSTVGGLVAVVKKPQNYDYNFVKLLFLIVLCAAITALALSVITKVTRRVSRLIATDEAIVMLESQNNRPPRKTER